MVDIYCEGNEVEIDKVKTKTAENFYFWLERKKKINKKKEAAYAEQTKKKR